MSSSRSIGEEIWHADVAKEMLGSSMSCWKETVGEKMGWGIYANDSWALVLWYQRKVQSAYLSGHYRALVWNEPAKAWQENPDMGITVNVVVSLGIF